MQAHGAILYYMCFVVLARVEARGIGKLIGCGNISGDDETQEISSIRYCITSLLSNAYHGNQRPYMTSDLRMLLWLGDAALVSPL